ncbi:hypothetical protein SVAN01_02316 [Stagonosporopsis vannaccii]|nr:hypothetical protein SVAN01_02316 [Stagonosporopsis vannaccii]
MLARNTIPRARAMRLREGYWKEARAGNSGLRTIFGNLSQNSSALEPALPVVPARNMKHGHRSAPSARFTWGRARHAARDERQRCALKTASHSSRESSDRLSGSGTLR